MIRHMDRWPLRRALLAFLMTAFLMTAAAGCATGQRQILTREVRTPVAVKCAPTLPDPPTYAADVAPLDGTIFELAQSLLIDREQRKARELALQAALKSCAGD